MSWTWLIVGLVIGGLAGFLGCALLIVLSSAAGPD
jgi:hypothetical protein